VQLLEAGRVAVVVITEPFRALADTALRARGWGEVPVVVLDRELERLDRAGLDREVARVWSVVTERLGAGS
jgi:hypothetical protein